MLFHRSNALKILNFSSLITCTETLKWHLLYLLFYLVIYRNNFLFVFIIEEILESIRAKKADTDNVKSPEEIEKDKNETENDSKDAQKSREFEDQSLEKDSEYKTPDDDPEQGKSEGKKLLD